MSKILSGVAIIAALAIATPALAQRSGPGPTAQTTTGPGVYPPGGYGPSSPMINAEDEYPNPAAPTDVPLGTTWPTRTQSAGTVPPAVSPQSQ
jgi:hypothetical protein